MLWKKFLVFPLRLANLLCVLFFFEAYFGFNNQAEHIPRKANTMDDALSRNHIHLYHSLYPQVRATPCTVPFPLVTLLLDLRLTWTSQCCSRLFKDILSKVSPRVQGPVMLRLVSRTLTSVQNFHCQLSPFWKNKLACLQPI